VGTQESWNQGEEKKDNGGKKRMRQRDTGISILEDLRPDEAAQSRRMQRVGREPL